MKRWTMAPVLALMLLPTTACEDLLFDNPEHVYSGPPMVEFAPVLPSGNYSRTITLAETATTNEMTTVRVNYIAESPTNEVSGQIMREASSTAVEGTHYRFAGGSGTYTIPAGANFVDVQIEVLADGFDVGERVTLVLELVDGPNFDVSENYKQFTLTLEKGS